MGAVITSAAACEEFGEDPAGFASQFDLDPRETASLIAMQDDLTALMPGFVQKRRRALRRSSRRTLNVLGDRGPDLLAEYADLEPARHRMRDDWLAFADFLVEHTEACTERHEHGRFIAEVARFERAAILTQQHSRPLIPQIPSQPNAEISAFDPDRPLRVTSPAAVESFGWDLRAVRSFGPRTPESVPADPCVLVFIHTGTRRGEQIFRIHPDCAAALATIREAPGTPASVASEFCARPRQALNTLAQLHSRGGLV